MTDDPTHLAEVAEAGEPQPELLALYRQAFAEFGSRALWNIREIETPRIEDVLSIARPLRIEGNMDARRLAEKIERLARAHQ